MAWCLGSVGDRPYPKLVRTKIRHPKKVKPYTPSQDPRLRRCLLSGLEAARARTNSADASEKTIFATDDCAQSIRRLGHSIGDSHKFATFSVKTSRFFLYSVKYCNTNKRRNFWLVYKLQFTRNLVLVISCYI